MSPKHFEFGPFLKRVHCAAFLECVIELSQDCRPLNKSEYLYLALRNRPHFPLISRLGAFWQLLWANVFGRRAIWFCSFRRQCRPQGWAAEPLAPWSFCRHLWALPATSRYLYFSKWTLTTVELCFGSFDEIPCSQLVGKFSFRNLTIAIRVNVLSDRVEN